MRRREAPEPAPVAALEHFRYEDWRDEAADGPLPVYWRADETWMWHKIRAYKRYLAARLAARGREGFVDHG